MKSHRPGLCHSQNHVAIRQQWIYIFLPNVHINKKKKLLKREKVCYNIAWQSQSKQDLKVLTISADLAIKAFHFHTKGHSYIPTSLCLLILTLANANKILNTYSRIFMYLCQWPYQENLFWWVDRKGTLKWRVREIPVYRKINAG